MSGLWSCLSTLTDACCSATPSNKLIASASREALQLPVDVLDNFMLGGQLHDGSGFKMCVGALVRITQKAHRQRRIKPEVEDSIHALLYLVGQVFATRHMAWSLAHNYLAVLVSLMCAVLVLDNDKLQLVVAAGLRCALCAELPSNFGYLVDKTLVDNLENLCFLDKTMVASWAVERLKRHHQTQEFV